MIRQLLTMWGIALFACVVLVVYVGTTETVEGLLFGTLMVCIVLTIAIVGTVHVIYKRYITNKQGR